LENARGNRPSTLFLTLEHRKCYVSSHSKLQTHYPVSTLPANFFPSFVIFWLNTQITPWTFIKVSLCTLNFYFGRFAYWTFILNPCYPFSNKQTEDTIMMLSCWRRIHVRCPCHVACQVRFSMYGFKHTLSPEFLKFCHFTPCTFILDLIGKMMWHAKWHENLTWNSTSNIITVSSVCLLTEGVKRVQNKNSGGKANKIKVLVQSDTFTKVQDAIWVLSHYFFMTQNDLFNEFPSSASCSHGWDAKLRTL